jgi:hypothetical protein
MGQFTVSGVLRFTGWLAPTDDQMPVGDKHGRDQ